jgi:hypothetical protein
VIRLSQIKKTEKSVEKKALFSGPAAESVRPRLKAGAAEKAKATILERAPNARSFRD